MGKKGDRGRKEGLAKDLYAQGTSLTDIAIILDSSVTTLSRWKKATKSPRKDLDEWDLAVQLSGEEIEIFRKLKRDDIAWLSGMTPSERTSQDYLQIEKITSIVRELEANKRAEIARLTESSTPADIDKPALFLGFLEWQALKLKETDPEGLKILARNFDSLVIQFKTEHAAGEQ